ncbi:TM0106 family RecB-like putative nuclease [Mycobacterium sp.]|uniref:TM0106 family RecB-like putative nuclease n=1 Tax=Mycobacterium sp. TaxID=1785 RepID=UPI002B824A0D|nr:TM0106 family RecB-like putative nuclease [Mycobacterium sp.]HME50315.1 TM0106 family RecB-like putative nuclease [Mycobacterium sp.]
MFVDDGLVIYSASDLAAAARCEYALLRAFDARLGRGPEVDADGDELLRRTVELGGEHEERELARFVAAYGDGVVRIGRPSYTVAAFRAAARATAAAFRSQPAVVYQAALFDGRFVGFADFVVRDGDAYRVLDTKLARRAKIEALLQVAGYTDALRAMGVPVARTAGLILGDGSVVDYPVDDLIPVYRQQRAALEKLLDRHLAGGEPASWADQQVGACLRCPACEPHIREDDDLVLVANMRPSQRATLIEAGVSTVAGLAAHTGTIEGLAEHTLATLTAQARLQVAERESGEPRFEVFDPEPLGALPQPDPGDLFFDFEGDPLWTDDGVTWGLEYLFGVLETNGAFRPLWAHDRRSERKALADFLALVRKRRKRHPNMHIYHYGAYEKTALLHLAARYGVGEDDVDNLLRDDVLVDLLPLVRKSIRVGAESYSLKSLERLYMGSDRRSGDVTTAADSITQYARYTALLDAGRADEAGGVLKEIEDYNRYDCRSTRLLRNQLLLLAFEGGTAHLRRDAGPGEQVPPDDDVAATLTRFAGEPAVSGPRDPEQTAAALINAARGYYVRERKPHWWAHFDRLVNPVDEWGDTSGVFRVDRAEVTADWHLPPRARKPRRQVRLTGELLNGALVTGRQVCVLYDRPAPPGLDDAHPDRRAAGTATLCEITHEVAGVPVQVLIEETGGNAGPFDHLPMAITPGYPIKTDSQQRAVDALAAEAAAALQESPPQLPRCAAVDILCRRAPRTASGAVLPRADSDIESITTALLDLDRSYIAVHGPPGTGKTYTGARVIARLVNENHWRIGVVAQSHAVVENVLREVVRAGVDPSVVAKKTPHDPAPAWQRINENQYAAFIDANAGCVVGGTAWDFSNDNRVVPGSLDLVVIDEAGQFSLANTVAVARAARNLLLLGDPQQLAEVSTGIHPEPVDTSALGWLVGGRDVLPDEFGYFLAQTRRMHPAVCRAVSALSYDNRLQPHPVTATRRLEGHAPGLRTLCVEHTDNDTASAEEAQRIAEEIRGLIGTPWTDGDTTRPLAGADVLVVAAYNAQVLQVRRHLRDAGLVDVQVGTVDKIQGGQAPVVFVSMAASTVDDVPRGISFLLHRNRLNVAISRAIYLAVIVRSPALTQYLPSTPHGLIELGAFLSLSPCDTPAR